MNKESNKTESLYNSGNSIGKFYAERGVINDYPYLEDIVEPKFVNELLMEKKLFNRKQFRFFIENEDGKPE